MRTPILLILLLIPCVIACASDPESPANGGSASGRSPDRSAGRNTSERSSTTATSSKTPEATHLYGKAFLVEWRNLNPEKTSVKVGLMNESSPDAPRLVRDPEYRLSIKPVKDQVMSNLVTSLDHMDFFEFATKGATALDYRGADWDGVVTVRAGDETWALGFRKGMPNARSSRLPTVYRDAKVLIMTVYDQTLHFTATTTTGDPDRVFGIPRPKVPRR
jgi:hypothetical protein